MTKKILIIDDDADIRSMVCSVLEADGYQIVQTVDGTTGIAAYQASDPDVIIVDMMMPDMKGNEVADKIRKLPGGELVPIMMLTARDGVKDKVLAFGDGVDEYITKPFHYQELQGRVKALLRIRDLNLSLKQKNDELRAMQEKLIQKERQDLVNQLAGTAAHRLGQPLSAIMLNCHLVETLPQSDERHQKALQAIKDDSKRMADLINKLRKVDATKTEAYFSDTDILDIKEAIEPK